MCTAVKEQCSLRKQHNEGGDQVQDLEPLDAESGGAHAAQGEHQSHETQKNKLFTVQETIGSAVLVLVLRLRLDVT